MKIDYQISIRSEQLNSQAYKYSYSQHIELIISPLSQLCNTHIRITDEVDNGCIDNAITASPLGCVYLVIFL